MEFVASTAAAIVAKIAESLVAPFGRRFGYLIHHDSNIKILQEQAEKLHDKEAALKLDIEAAERRGEVIAPGVDSWLKKVDQVNNEVGKILGDDIKVNSNYLNGRSPDLKSRYSLSRKARKKIQEVAKLQEDGKFSKTSYPAPLPSKLSMFPDHFVGFPSRILIVNNILEALKDDDMMNMIGICGMGGVGKTTLVKEVIKEVEKENLFDEIVMVVVSQTPDTKRMQAEIGDRIGLKLEESVSVRASRLRHRLKEIQRILIILDDVWTELDLEEIGIPFRDGHHGCKIIIASHMEDVCNKMKSQKNFQISVLSESEAWDLFLEMAGPSTEHPDVLPIAKEVARECGGLPLAILTVGKALRHKDKYIWEDAFQQLKKSTITSFSEMHEYVFSRVELSYQYLKNEELRSCFLLCSLFPEDFNIPVEYLVRYGVGLRLFKGIDSLADARNRVQAIVDKLKKTFLLLESEEEECVKMHDVVRDVALSIASKDKHVFLVRCDSQLKEWPHGDTYEHYTASSFVFEKIKEGADSLECPKLQLLQLLCRDRSQNVPYNLLEGMKILKVLALQDMSILTQPPPLQALRKLQTLHLEHCELKDVSILGVLENLEILSLVGSRILELPTELGQLRCLRLLDATECTFVKGIPPGVLSLLSQLEELYIRESFYRWEHVEEKNEPNDPLLYPKKRCRNASVAELKSLSHLKTIDIHMPDARCLPKDMPFHNLTRFKISIRSGMSEKGLYLFQNTLKIEADVSAIMDTGIRNLLRKTEVLSLNLANLKNVYTLDREGFPSLKDLTLDNCSDLLNIIDAGDLSHHSRHAPFPLLESLSLCKLANLREIWHRPVCDTSLVWEETETEVIVPCIQEVAPLRKETTQLLCFGNLRFLNISGCSKLKNLFPMSMARGLVRLQDFYMGGCADMEEIFLEEEEKCEFVFPKLTNLKLFMLPQLIGFCKGLGDVEAKQLILNHQVKLSGGLELSSPDLKNIQDIQGDHLDPISHKLFTSHWMSRLLYLEKLEVHGCKLLQVMFDFETLNAGEGKKTIQTLMQLEEIRLYFLPELTHVWNRVPKGFQGFKRLKVLSVERCNSLTYLFSLPTVKLLVELERINLEDCAMMESIVARERGEVKEVVGAVIFNKLISFHIRNLPRLESVCPDPCIFKWPSLNILQIIECPKMKTFRSTIQSLEKPMLKGTEDAIRGSPMPNDVHHDSPSLSQCVFQGCFGCSPFHRRIKSSQGVAKKKVALHNIVDSNVSHVAKTQSHVALNPIDGHQQLQRLELNYCELVEVVFDHEENYTTSVLNNLETLILSSLPNLMCTWKLGIQNITGFQNLKRLEIHECNSLKNSIPVMIARLFIKIEEIKITACELMEEIVAQGGQEEKKDTIIFPQLNSIILSDLPNLIRFCSGSCAIEFPKLTTMKLVGCSKLDTFVAADVLTPRLKMILAESLSCPLRGDLNNTIQEIFKGKMFESIESTLHFNLRYPEAGNHLTHIYSSTNSGDETIGEADRENEFELGRDKSFVDKEVEGGRTSEDGHFQRYETEIEGKDTLQMVGTMGEKQWKLDENERGEGNKDALEKDEAKETDNEKVKEDDSRVDKKGKAIKEDEQVDTNNICDNNIIDYVSDDASERNFSSLLLPTIVVPERDHTMLSASSSQGNGASTCLTQFRIGAYADFHGFEVESHYVSYLEKFYKIEGSFWDSCIFKSSIGISFLLNMLGGALHTLDKVLKSLTYKELKLIRDSIEDVSKAGFRIDSLRPVVEKVKVIIECQERHNRLEHLEREMNVLEVRLAEINRERATLQQQLTSDIVGIDFSVNYFSTQY